MKTFVKTLATFCCVVVTVDSSCEQTLFQPLPDCGRNRALVGFVFHTVNVSHKEKCGVICVQYENCTSFNVGLVPNAEGKFQCELNSKFYSVACSHLSIRQNFEFYTWVCFCFIFFS